MTIDRAAPRDVELSGEVGPSNDVEQLNDVEPSGEVGPSLTADARELPVDLTVSVVIPVKDDAGPLAVCLAALARQTTSPFEIVVVDNGSVDDSAEVARRFGARVVVEGVPGIGAASRRGYDSATGALLARLDADTVPADDWVETISRLFHAHPDIAAVTGWAAFVDGPRLLRLPVACLYLGGYFLTTGAALTHVPLFGSNMALRRSAWDAVRDRVHWRDTLTHDDLDLSFHLGAAHRIRFRPELRVGVSMRPLWDRHGLLRLRRGMRTITLHWPHELPWLRWWRRHGRRLGARRFDRRRFDRRRFDRRRQS